MLKVGDKIKTIVTPQILKDFPEARGVEGIVESKPYKIGDELVIEVVYEGNKERSIVPVKEVEKIEEAEFPMGSHKYLEELKSEYYAVCKSANKQIIPSDLEDHMATVFSKEANISYDDAMRKVRNFYVDNESKVNEFVITNTTSDDALFDELGRLENMKEPNPDNEEQRQATISKVKQELWDRGFTRKDMKKEESKVKESEEYKDSPYLQRELEALIQDAKQNGEKDLVAFYDYLLGRLDQSFPDGDVTRKDVDDLLNEPRGREVGRDIPIWVIDDLFEATEIKQMYKKAGIKAPDGKGIHTKKFHEIATAIKKDNPDYPMDRCYSIAMGKLGKEKAVKKDHRSESKIEEGSRDDFLMEYGSDIKRLLSSAQRKVQELSTLSEEEWKAESDRTLSKIERIYDKEVVSMIDSILGGSRVELRDVIHVAMDILNYHGTEPMQVVNALEDAFGGVGESNETNIRDKHNLKEGDTILVRASENGSPIGEDGTCEIESFEYEGSYGDEGIVVKVDNKSLYGILEELDDVPVVFIQMDNESTKKEEQEPEALAKPLADIEKEYYKKFVDEVTTKIKKKDYVRLMTIDTCVLYCGTVTDISKKGVKIDSDNLLVGKVTVDMLNIANIEKVENSEVAIRVERLAVKSSEEDV